MRTCGDCRHFRPVHALRSNTKGECLKGHMADRNYMRACKAHFEPKEDADNADKVVRGLRYQSQKHKNDVVLTGGLNISDMARDAADLIDSLKAQLTASQRREQAAVECIASVEEALDFQRYTAATLRISEWHGPRVVGKGDNDA